MIVGIVATVFPAWKCEMILIFLNINKSIEVFKELYLFPLSASWSGSEIPLIDKKIKFLEELYSSLKGIDYIEHKKYLKECIASEESYKEKVEMREYLENVDYAQWLKRIIDYDLFDQNYRKNFLLIGKKLKE